MDNLNIKFIGQPRLINDDIKTATIEECLEWLDSITHIQVDTETEGFDVHICKTKCVQFGNRDIQYVIDTSIYPLTLFKQVMEDDSKIKLFQNAKFDLRFFYAEGIYPKNIYDTFLAECILTTGYEDDGRLLALDDLVEKYTNGSMDKSIRGDIHREGLTSRVIRYAANDVRWLEDIRDRQLEQIIDLGLINTLNLENEVVCVFARMEFNGVLIDSEKWKQVAIGVEQEVKECLNTLDGIVKEEPRLNKYVPKYIQGNLFDEPSRDLNINWSSSTQKLKILQDLGFDVESTGDRILQRIKKRHKIVPVLLDYNKKAKLATAFGMKFLKFVNKKTKRVHYNVWQILSTGRISVSEPNLNQIPSKGDLAKTIRSCFIAPKGYKIVGGDFSGMELRIIANYSKDPLWLESFNSGQDLHSVLCAATFDIPITDVKKETPFKPGVTYRDVQKTINFGLAYGMTEHKLADTMQIEVKKAKEIIDKFFSVVPKVSVFLDGLAKLGLSRGYVRTAPPYGRIRFFPQWKQMVDHPDDPQSFKISGEIERRSKNTPIQGTNGDIIKQALIELQDIIDENNYDVKILLAVYDEIQTECKEEFAEEWKTIMDSKMVEVAKRQITEIPVVVDCSINDYWTK